MKVSLKWLKDYVDVPVTPAELAERLTMAGSEVKAIEVQGGGWENVSIGQIMAINPHPNADRLRLATVETAQGEQIVVCGAPNLTIGDKIAFASVGAELKDGHTGQTIRLKPAKIRGVESKGMICSEMELGLSTNHEGILVLPPDAPIGMPLNEYMGDTVIDLDITPNRPDCLSVIGIARETAALIGQKTRVPEITYSESDIPVSEKISVEIQAPDLCPRYCASLITGVQIKPSPKWMQDRLLASGLRPINNIVDISNYVMLEYGQPLHTFDYDKIQGGKIIVRRAQDNEIFQSLDSVERKLNSRMLVIADAERSVAIAGVMGGANSEVTGQTANILLEAASFNPISIHNTGEALNLPSESRYRFERGLSSGLTLPALKRATQLIVELGSGTACKGWVDVYPGKVETKPILFSQMKLQRLTGVEYGMEEIITILTSLGMDVKKTSTDTDIEVTAPYWRSDIHLEEDLIEEVARISGYDKIPNTLLAAPLPHLKPDPIFRLKSDLQSGLVAEGFSEVLNFSLTSRDLLNKLFPQNAADKPVPVRVANPMTAEMEYLRTSLRATLLTAFAANRRYEEGSIRLFECSKVYIPRQGELPDERETLCAVMGGRRFAQSWLDSHLALDFYDAKGIVESLLGRLGLEPLFEKGQEAGLHPHKQAVILLEQQKIGVVAEVHPEVLLAFEITEPVYLLEIDLKTLVKFTAAQRDYQPVPRFPAIVRDMALIVDAGVGHHQVKQIITAFPLVEDAEIFDVYSGGQVPSGKKSLAYRISYRSPKHTLTDEEVTRVQEQVLHRLNTELGAVLRS